MGSSSVANRAKSGNLERLKPIEQFSDEHLRVRIQGLAKSLFFRGGQLTIPSEVSSAFREAVSESDKRGMPATLGLDGLIDPNDPEPVFHEQHRVRYGSTERLEAFKAGVVSLSPAKCYSALENAAQKDDELLRSWHAADTVFSIGGVDYPASDLVMRRPLKEKGGAFVHYHCLSMSTEESVKLQRAFNAEGYVLIQNYRTFYEVLSKTLREKCGNVHCCSSAIKYYDDRQDPTLSAVEDFIFSKSFLYQYQSEVRFAVLDAPSPEEWLQVPVSWPSDLISTVKSLK